MDGNRNDRDDGRDDFRGDDMRHHRRGSGENRMSGGYGGRRDAFGGGDYGSQGDVRGDERRNHGERGGYYGSRPSDDDMRGGGGYGGGERGYDAGRSGGGYDEWSRRGSRSFGDRYSSEGSRGDYGGNRFDNRDLGEGYYGSVDYDRYGSNQGSRGGPSRHGSGRSYGGGERGYEQGGRSFWDKAGDEVSSWFGDKDAERRREQDQHRGRGPKGYSRSDERIKEDVNDRLTDDGWLDASNIEVDVKSREVTLSGTVSDRNAKRRAEDIAESVSGVAHVQNNLRVKAGGDASATDVDVDRMGGVAVAKPAAGGQR